MTGFRADEAGAVTVDWVALTAMTLLLGTAVVYTIFEQGVVPLVDIVNDEMRELARECNGRSTLLEQRLDCEG